MYSSVLECIYVYVSVCECECMHIHGYTYTHIHSNTLKYTHNINIHCMYVSIMSVFECECMGYRVDTWGASPTSVSTGIFRILVLQLGMVPFENRNGCLQCLNCFDCSG